jgi:hypothetical protein
MNLGTKRRKIKINPHVEMHGNYSIEWSYHFPLQAGMRIESSFELWFPAEKIPGAARDSLLEANLSTTRLSFADSAHEVGMHSLWILRDTAWVMEFLKSGHHKSSNQELLSSEVTVKYFTHKAREYWSHGFLARMGVLLQSDLKQSEKAMRAYLRGADLGQVASQAHFQESKRELAASLRSAYRIIQTWILWREMTSRNAQEDSKRIVLPLEAEGDGPLMLLTEMQNLAEFAMMLAARHIADLQDQVRVGLEMTQENILLLNTRKALLDDEIQTAMQDLTAKSLRLEKEKRWLQEWARICGEWRIFCHLPPFSEIILDPDSAATYFERMRDLKKRHYQVWDLGMKLESNDKRFDFWIGAGAAGVSAAFAFAATYSWTLYQAGGATTLEEQSAIALSVFALGNVIVYILKDRLKEFMKFRLREMFHVKSSSFIGECYTRMAGKSQDDKKAYQGLAEVRREAWWARSKETWTFRMWESFRILPESHAVNARIVKQTWRLPLDEILHSFDDTSHTLKFPNVDGVPKEIKVVKRTAFPFKLTVTVKSLKNRELTVVDQEFIQGRVITAGEKILRIE